VQDAGETLVLSRAAIAGRVAPLDYVEAVEHAFRALAAGAIDSLPAGHVPGEHGAFHIKSAVAKDGERRAAIKINGNFPGNPRATGLPTIQGCIVLVDATNGRLLALMDSIEITALRTAAASAVATRHLARRDAATIALVGCGVQARYHLDSLLALPGFAFRALRLFDVDRARAEALGTEARGRGLEVTIDAAPAAASRHADVVVTCTPSSQPILYAADVRSGTFIAAVGADSPQKNEIAPDLMAAAHVVPDIGAQAAAMGDLRAAIAAGAMTAGDVHAELADVVTRTRPGRSNDTEIFVFDSTGTAIEDLVAANLVYERALADPSTLRVGMNFVDVQEKRKG
jgi:ornithine cyclodeaminase/alanine dehydrogenase-like protein (mu-crystallin family)